MPFAWKLSDVFKRRGRIKVNALPPKGSLEATAGATAHRMFEPLVITSERATVLARLTAEANQHFGHSRLEVSNVSVTAMEDRMVLASATFTASFDD